MMGGKLTSGRLARIGLTIGFLGATLFVVLHHASDIQSGITAVKNIAISDLVLGFGLVCLTFVVAALSYRMLVFRSLKFSELLVVELAAAFVNRLIPSGIGGLGLHGVYLHKRKHTIAQATAVVSANNFIGICIHLVLFFGLLVTTDAFGRLPYTTSTSLGVVAALVIIVVLVTLLIIKNRLRHFLHNLYVSLSRYSREPHHLIYAALALLSLTLINLLILYTIAGAVGVSIGVTSLFIVYSIGVLLGSVVPTPGGLAAVEAGLVAGFLAYNIPVNQAITITLTFRLLTYWLPLFPGVVAFILARHKCYI